MSTNHKEKINNLYIVLGKRGHGKTAWTRKFLESQKRVILLDPIRDYEGFEYYDRNGLLDEVERLVNEPDSTSFKIATQDKTCLDLVCNAGMILGNCWVVIEECGVHFHKGSNMPDDMSTIVFTGRHRNCSLILTAQRAVSIPIDARSQATRFISFKQTESRDLDWLKDYLTSEEIDELTQFQKLECFDVDEDEKSHYFLSFSKKKLANSENMADNPSQDD